MATVMEVQTAETRTTRRPYFSAIRWGAIIAGVVSGSASYLLLALLGVAVGLTAVEPASAEPLGRVPLATGIWTGISMLVGAFIGGYVAGHMSGLQRSMDGMLHGFVSWGATTLLYAVLTTTAIGALLGGTFRIINQGIQTVGTAAGSAAQGASQGGGQSMLDQMSTMMGVQVNAQSLQSVQQALRAGDRDSAVNIMVNEMGMDPDRASQVAEKMSALLSPQGQQNARETVKQTASQATDVLATTSWWLFIGLLLSLALGIAGGATGVRASANRLAGDHTAERHPRIS
ncbi:MAG: hypothetical protein ACJ8KO_07050 [Sulfurifustaceae bacterium]